MINKIKRWWKRKSGKRKAESGNPRAVTETELGGRFALAPDNPLWEATLTVLTEKINTLGTEAANESLTDRQILWRVAGVDALMEFLEDLRGREAKARQMQHEQENTEGTEI